MKTAVELGLLIHRQRKRTLVSSDAVPKVCNQFDALFDWKWLQLGFHDYRP